MSSIGEFHNTALTANPSESSGDVPLDLDPARYRADVDGFDISEAQKQELLLTLWSIIRRFVELGFEADVCGLVFPQAASHSAAIPERDDLG